MKKVILSLLLACPVLTMTAQRNITTGGGISDQMLQEIKQAQRQTATADRALRNALKRQHCKLHRTCKDRHGTDRQISAVL